MRLMDRFVAICASVAIAASALPAVPAEASPKDELEAVRQELEEYGEKLAEVKTKLVQGSDQLNITESEIVERQKDADKTKKKLSKAQKILAEHIREDYRSGSNASIVSMLLESQTVEDLTSRMYYFDKVAKSNADAIIGRRGRVVETIEAGGYGRVAIDGDVWKAVSNGQEAVAVGSFVRVVGRESTIITVESAE